MEVDHLVFIVHGIGSACDMKFRNIAEVVDGFRELAGDMSERHFQSAHLSGKKESYFLGRGVFCSKAGLKKLKLQPWKDGSFKFGFASKTYFFKFLTGQALKFHLYKVATYVFKGSAESCCLTVAGPGLRANVASDIGFR